MKKTLLTILIFLTPLSTTHADPFSSKTITINILPEKELTNKELDDITNKAENGDAEAQSKLGQNFLAQQNEAAAFEWLEKAAKQNHVRSITLVAIFKYYAKGNSKEAMPLFEKAGALGDEIAMLFARGLNLDKKNFNDVAIWEHILQENADSELIKESLTLKFMCNETELKPVDKKFPLLESEILKLCALYKKVTPDDIQKFKKYKSEN